MAKRSGVSLPSGQGGLIGGMSSSYHTKFQFSPKLVVFFALLIVGFVWVLFNVY